MNNARFAQCLAAALLGAASATAHADEYTAALPVKSIQVTTGAPGSSAAYYIRTTNSNGWAAPVAQMRATSISAPTGPAQRKD